MLSPFTSTVKEYVEPPAGIVCAVSGFCVVAGLRGRAICCPNVNVTPPGPAGADRLTVKVNDVVPALPSLRLTHH